MVKTKNTVKEQFKKLKRLTDRWKYWL